MKNNWTGVENRATRESDTVTEFRDHFPGSNGRNSVNKITTTTTKSTRLSNSKTIVDQVATKREREN